MVMLVTKQLFVAVDFHGGGGGGILLKSMVTSNCLVTNIVQDWKNKKV